MTIDLTDGWVNLARRDIFDRYGDVVTLEKGKKSLLKFGQNDAVGTTTETVWRTGGNETYLTDNLINKISSSDDTDTQDVVIEGHIIGVDGDFTYVSQTVTLVGQTETSIDTPLARVSRIYNDNGVDFAGTIYVYEDDTVSAGVPQTPAKIHIQAAGADNQSQKAAVTVAKDEYWLISEVYAFVNIKTAGKADFLFQVREKGKTFRTRIPGSANSLGSAFSLNLRPFLIVPKNADFRIVATADQSQVSVVAWASGAVAKIVT